MPFVNSIMTEILTHISEEQHKLFDSFTGINGWTLLN